MRSDSASWSITRCRSATATPSTRSWRARATTRSCERQSIWSKFRSRDGSPRGRSSGPRPRTPQGPGCPSASGAAPTPALLPGHAAWPEALQTRPGPCEVGTGRSTSGVRDGHHKCVRVVRLLGNLEGSEVPEGPETGAVQWLAGSVGFPTPNDGRAGRKRRGRCGLRDYARERRGRRDTHSPANFPLALVHRLIETGDRPNSTHTDGEIWPGG